MTEAEQKAMEEAAFNFSPLHSRYYKAGWTACAAYRDSVRPSESDQEAAKFCATNNFRVQPEDVGYGYIYDSFLAGCAHKQRKMQGEIDELNKRQLSLDDK